MFDQGCLALLRAQVDALRTQAVRDNCRTNLEFDACALSLSDFEAAQNVIGAGSSGGLLRLVQTTAERAPAAVTMLR